MSDLARAEPESAAQWSERVQAWALLLPAVTLAWPGPWSPIAGDPHPELTGAALAAFASLPSLVAAALRRSVARAPWVLAFALFVAVGLMSLVLHPPTDALEESRASLLAAVALAALIGGASLGDQGRAALVRALPLLALLALVPALADRTAGFAGALGNTGSTSELALIGSVAGVWLFARGDGAWRWIGGATAALHALFSGLAPVLAGALALAFALVIALLTVRGRRAWILVLAGFALVAFGAARLSRIDFGLGGHPSQARATASATSGGDVRALIWRSTLPLIRDYALLGTGPGQFAAAFPPYRDPREIELSSHNRALTGVETEVEHAHNDWVQGVADAGLLGGAAWLVFLGAVAWASWSALRRHEGDRAALGAVALCVLANALLREPLLWNAASSSAAFAVFGALLERRAAAPGQRSWVSAVWLALAGAALAVQLPRAWRIASHGRALGAYLRTHDAGQLTAALEACPDSVAALSLAARRVEAQSDEHSLGAVIDAWKAVLAVRPHRFDALMQLGIAYAAQERLDLARATWSHALALDPTHPALLRNFVRLEALLGDIDAAQRWCERAKQPVVHLLGRYGIEALRELELERGWALLERADPRTSDLGAERAYQLAQDAALGLDRDLAGALEGSAHVAWARQHADAGRFADAVRSYRQAKRGLNVEPHPEQPPRWSASLHLELAAALVLDGRTDDAREELQGVAHTSREWLRLPEWAGGALHGAGLL